jgi:dihydropyrimidinase
VISAGSVVLDADGFRDPGPVGKALNADPIPGHLLT